MALHESPVIGTGPGTFYLKFNEYNQTALEVAGIYNVFDFAHNDYIQILCNCGLLGLAAFLCVLVGAAVNAIKYAQKDSIVMILGSAVLCYSIQVFFSFSIIIVAPLFFVCLGLLDWHCSRCKKESAK